MPSGALLWRWCCATALWMLAVCPTGLSVWAAEPLHVRVDQAIEQAALGDCSPPAGDSAFLRRIYLDLAGRIPPADEARRFLEDTSPNKRAAAIERLLGSGEYIRHMANVLDVILMERRPDKHVKADQWQKYLLESVAQNKPWDQLVRELLGADGTEEKIRAAAKFYMDRESEPNILTRDVGRVFFGMDLQCCQCHDHPLIDNYYQGDYYGIFAFLNRGFLFTGKDKKVFYAEKAEGDVTFTSVFTEEKSATRPRLPGDFEILEPAFVKGDEYKVKPAKNVRPIPKYSRRAKLAELVGSGRNKAFNRNIANRLWAHMMGRGLVYPLDLQHDDNPPAHPQLLDLLADELVAMKFDMKAFLRQLALTRAYQRSLDVPSDFGLRPTATADQLAQFEAVYQERKKDQDRIRKELQAAEQATTQERESASSIQEEFNKASAAVATARKKSAEATKQLTEAEKSLAGKQDVARLVGEAAAKTQEAAAKLSPDPELTQAAATFQARAEKLAAEVAAAQKSVDQLTPSAQAARQALAAAQAAATGVQQRLDQAHDELRAARAPLRAARHKLQAADVAALNARFMLEGARAATKHVQLISAAEASQQACHDSQAALVASREQLVQAESELPQVEDAVAVAQRDTAAVAAQLDQSKTAWSAQSQIAKTVADAAHSAAEASQKLPDDAELKQAAQSVKTRSDQVQAELTALEKAARQLQQTTTVTDRRLAAAQQQVRARQEKIATLEKRISQLEAQLPDLQTRAEQDRLARSQSQRELLQQWTQRFFTASLEALTPEQMAWSVMQASGLVAQQERAAQAEVDKNLPLDAGKPDEPDRLAQRERAREQLVYDKLKGHVGAFVKLFGHAAGQPQSDFFATVDQALFFSNADPLQSWLNPAAGNLTDRLDKLADPRALAEELYISVLTRRPTIEETADVAQYLKERPDERAAALKEMAWGLITSTEFRFSY